MYFPVQAKAAAFLLASSFFGGFFVATKINQYMFQKSKGKAGGGQENDREGSDGKKKKGQIAQEDKEEKEGESGEGQEDEEQGQEGDGDGLKTGGELKGKAAMRFLAGKSIRRNPGPYEPKYSYYVVRGFVGEGTSVRFSVRSWFLRNGQLCDTNAQAIVECIEFKIVTGTPTEGGPDIELSPKQVKKILVQADLKARQARVKKRQKAREEAAARGVPYKEPEEPDDATLVELEDPAMRTPVNGEPVGLMVVGDRAFPILKGNLINFPPFIPTVDDPRLSKSAELNRNAPEEKKPTPPPVKTPPKPLVDRQAKGFAAPVAKTAAFEAPKTSDKNSIRQEPKVEREAKSPPPTEPPITGMPAWEKILGRALAPVGAQPAKVQPFLGYFDSEGRFMQLVRDVRAPYEIILTMANWAFRDERICITGLQETATAPPSPQTRE